MRNFCTVAYFLVIANLCGNTNPNALWLSQNEVVLFYVSPTDNDVNPGTNELPLATIIGARKIKNDNPDCPTLYEIHRAVYTHYPPFQESIDKLDKIIE